MAPANVLCLLIEPLHFRTKFTLQGHDFLPAMFDLTECAIAHFVQLGEGACALQVVIPARASLKAVGHFLVGQPVHEA